MPLGSWLGGTSPEETEKGSAGSGIGMVGRLEKTRAGDEPRPEKQGRGFSDDVVLGC